MAESELAGCEYLLAAGKNWVEDQAIDQELLLLWYGLRPTTRPNLRPPYPSAKDSLTEMTANLALISAGQAAIATSIGAQRSSYAGLRGNKPARKILYAALLWSVVTSYQLKSVLKIERGYSTPEPHPATQPYPPIEASLAWIVAWMNKSVRDQGLLLARAKLRRERVRAPARNLSVPELLNGIEVFSGRITQDIIAVTATAPVRSFGGGKIMFTTL
jgi:hypothetical protein